MGASFTIWGPCPPSQRTLSVNLLYYSLTDCMILFYPTQGAALGFYISARWASLILIRLHQSEELCYKSPPPQRPGSIQNVILFYPTQSVALGFYISARLGWGYS